ncbi:MAG: hypothetical protein AAFV46_13615 [Cyanobacteria bacterium J06635_11]
MGRKQLRVYVDADEWAKLKAQTSLEDDKAVQAHLMDLYRALEDLKLIHPNPVVAVGIALANHQILGSAQWQRHVTVSTVDQALPQMTRPLQTASQHHTRSQTLEPADNGLAGDNAAEW